MKDCIVRALNGIGLEHSGPFFFGISQGMMRHS